MTNLHINPLGMVVNLIIGWFVLSFLQTALRSIFVAGGPSLWARFLDIALFRNGSGVLINVIAVIAFGGIGTVLWFLAKK
jgi:hypothetical protein